MFHNPWSRHREGNRGLVQGQHGIFGEYSVISQPFRNYLYANPSGLTAYNPPPHSPALVAFALNSSQAADLGVVTGAHELNRADGRTDHLNGAGVYGVTYATPAAGVAVGIVRGVDADGVFNGAGSATSVHGLLAYAEIDAGTVTTMSAIKTVGPSRVGGTVTNNYGIWISPLLASAATTQVGLQVDSIGGSNAFAVRTSGTDPSQFPGNIQGSAVLLSPSAATATIQTVDSVTSSLQIESSNGNWGSTQFATGSGAGGLGIAFCKTRGANAASHTIVQNNDTLGSFFGYGDDGVTQQESSGFKFQVDGTPGANNVPGRIIFLTVSTGQFMNEVGRWDSSGRLGIGVTPSHYLDIKGGSATIAQVRLASSTLLTTAAAGCIEYDGKVFYATCVASARQVTNNEQIQILTATRTFTANTSAQAIFNATANGAITLAASTSYEFEMLVVANSFSASAHTINIGFGGTATYTAVDYVFFTSPGPISGPTAQSNGYVSTNAASAVIASTTTNGFVGYFRGIIRINASGTVIPQLTQVTNSAAAVVQIGSFFRCWPIGTDTVTNIGNWS